MSDYEQRIVSADEFSLESKSDRALRPKRLEDYIGQQQIKELLTVSIIAAHQRNEPLDHTIIFGPPGLGKTTLANIIANEMNANIIHTTGPVLEKAADLAAILTNLRSSDILFIDEIHRIPPKVEEVLYSAMEDYKIDLVIGEGAGANTMRLDIPAFTLIGATTRVGSLTSPLLARFGNHYNLTFYNNQDLAHIIKISATKLEVEIDDDSCFEIARRSRGTPRIANRILRKVRDFAQVFNDAKISIEVTNLACNKLNIDKYGLDKLDYRLLINLMNHKNGTAGIDALAASIGEDRSSLEDVVEPYLIQQGFIIRTPRGRQITNKAIQYLESLNLDGNSLI